MVRNSSTVGRRSKVSVRQFVDAAIMAGLPITVESGAKDTGRLIVESPVNRPGLALTGYMKHFPNRRIQVLGLSEHGYLMSLPPEVREKRVCAFFARHLPCVVITRGRKVLPDIASHATAAGVPVLKTSMITGEFINAATILMEELCAPREKIQGTMVEILGIGVLITGEPGIGKSEIALSLIRKGYSLVADDIATVRIDTDGALMVSPVDATKFHMELRGLGIVHVPSLFGIASVRMHKRLDLVVHLKKTAKLSGDSRQKKAGQVKIMGVDVPMAILPVAAGRDMAGLVEVAAFDQKLKSMGHDAAKELDAKLIEVMSRGGKGRE